MKGAFLLASLALVAGCASTVPNTVEESGVVSEVVYETQIQGNHAELAGCMADALRDHEKNTVPPPKYVVRKYPAESEIQAYKEGSVGGIAYLFTIELQQEKDPLRLQQKKEIVRVVVRDIAGFKELVEEAIQSCSPNP